MTEDVLLDNTSAWSADHCADALEVPGVLCCNKQILGKDPSLIDIAPFPRKPLPVCEMVSPMKPLEALAMERSLDAATRFNGGDLGYFTADIMPDSYEAALKSAKAGQTIGPFQVEGGWALVKVEDRRPEQPITLEAARPQIVRFLTYDQVRDLLEKLRGQAKVQTFLQTTPDVPGQPREPASGTPAPQDKPQGKTEGTQP